MEPTISYLPIDIIFEILLQLPVEWLPELKLVCKQWRSIISSTHFIEAHLHRSHPGVIFQNRLHKATYRTRFVEITQGAELRTRELDTTCHGRVRASCSGLLLIERTVDLYVVNPITKRISVLPDCEVSYKYPIQYETYGFGFDARTRDFKVVHLCEYKKKSFLGCEILTLGSPSWREICGPFCGLTQLQIPITANGVLHWASGREHIVSMDVGNERFCETPFPNCKLDSYHLLELGDSLSLASHVSSFQIDLWMLKDFQSGNWVKQLSIGMECIRGLNVEIPLSARARRFRLQESLDHVFLVANLRDGEVIVFEYNWIDGGGLYAYDSKRERTIAFERCDSMCALDASSCPLHVNSLCTWKAVPKHLR